jgi:hypothetical protein
MYAQHPAEFDAAQSLLIGFIKPDIINLIFSIDPVRGVL